jgi:ATP-dependent protease ClpP protease subunit
VLRRKIYITGTIDEEAFLRFSKRLTVLEEQDNGPIDVELYSYGGEAYSALAFAARMRHSRCHIVVRAYGLVASAAVLILAAGDERMMSKEAWAMVHEDSGDAGELTTTQQEVVAIHGRKMELHWCHQLAVRTKASANKWLELHTATTYLNAKECLKLGLVDKII